MTQLEQETLTAIKLASRKYVGKPEIDWEQRRYEIAKDVLSALICNGDYSSNYAETAVAQADRLISKLKESAE